jgi:hypothetical protein
MWFSIAEGTQVLYSLQTTQLTRPVSILCSRHRCMERRRHLGKVVVPVPVAAEGHFGQRNEVTAAADVSET